ncbi:ankyrin repeat protein (macronuclear) [Tetrahymena thermophila SB210]|uniref:Ankyrin repeat protein n=1 Tax=Tetrahymena thermophila (strain SB210) TaxID=312017 RepID=I7LX82_TETTS|nr:ankyrin repeat protein [Tetrahymena thermophila SB210]EAS03935.2 ankyrin repeat protein [Tetrahymena thermophila SB210]|eukprot:XP_001024180.2 ankyrin repeat protein [Tetrahymena thermophila SB210]
MSRKSSQNGTIKNHSSYINDNSSQTKEIEKDTPKLSQNSNKNASAIENNVQQNCREAASSLLQNNQVSFNPSSSLMMGDKSNNTNSLDEEKMILEVILSGQLNDLKHFNWKNKTLNYVRPFGPTSSIDKKVTPLIVAVYCGNIDNVRELFNQKAPIDVNYPSKKQKLSPLMVACIKGQFEIMQYLIQKGADVCQTSVDGLPPLYYCFSRLEEDSNYFENKNLCIKMAQYLLEKGANVNQIVNEENKHTLLMQFCNIQDDLDYREKDINLSMIRFLVQNGADIFMKNAQGQDCYDLLDKHPYKEEVIKIFEQYENTMVSNFRISNENERPSQSQLLISQGSRYQQSKSKKKNSTLNTPQSSSRHLNLPNISQSPNGQSFSNQCQHNQQQQQQQQELQKQLKPQIENQTQQYRSKYNQNTEIEGEETKHKACCLLFF